MAAQTPSIGRSVHYRLTEEDATAINRRRTSSVSIAERLQRVVHQRPGADPVAAWPIGAQAHIGSPVEAGEVVPLTITRVLPDDGGINGQALLDGNDSFWVQGAQEGKDEEPGTWSWPPKV